MNTLVRPSNPNNPIVPGPLRELLTRKVEKIREELTELLGVQAGQEVELQIWIRGVEEAEALEMGKMIAEADPWIELNQVYGDDKIYSHTVAVNHPDNYEVTILPKLL